MQQKFNMSQIIYLIAFFFIFVDFSKIKLVAEKYDFFLMNS